MLAPPPLQLEAVQAANMMELQQLAMRRPLPHRPTLLAQMPTPALAIHWQVEVMTLTTLMTMVLTPAAAAQQEAPVVAAVVLQLAVVAGRERCSPAVHHSPTPPLA